MAKELTLKQQRFVEEYIQNGANATQASKTAGYAGNPVTLASVGSENLRKPQIRQAIAQRQASLRRKVVGKTQERLQSLWQIVLDGTEMMDVTHHKTGEVIYRKMVDPKAAISAIAEMNKMTGDHAPHRAEVNQRVTFERTLEVLEQRRKSTH